MRLIPCPLCGERVPETYPILKLDNKRKFVCKLVSKRGFRVCCLDCWLKYHLDNFSKEYVLCAIALLLKEESLNFHKPRGKKFEERVTTILNEYKQEGTFSSLHKV